MATLVYTGPSDIDFDPESVTTVTTNTFESGTSASVANGVGNWANAAVTIDINAITYDQDFIAADTAHPDGNAGDLTIKAILANDGVDNTALTITNSTGNGAALGNLTAAGTFRFTVLGIEEGCEVKINYDLHCDGDNIDGEEVEIGVESVKGLNGCDFQDVLKYQQLNQKLNNRFDADTKEFSSFKDMLKRIKRVK